MKKLALGISSVSYLLSSFKVFAVTNIQVTTPINPNNNQPIGYSDLGKFVTNLLGFAFAIAILIVLIMLVWGAFEWITSGGDKEAVGKARGRIINAMIGIAVLAVAFALAKVAGQFLGFPDLGNIPIPTPPPQ